MMLKPNQTVIALATALILLVLGAPLASAQEISALKGHDTDGSIEISADSVEVRQRDDIVVFVGNVVATQGDMVFQADRVTVYYTATDTASDPQMSRLDAEGSVKLVSPSETAEGDWGIYDVSSQLVTLGGDVILLRGQTEVRGQHLELDLETGVARFNGGANVTRENGRVEGRFDTPDDGDGN